MGLLLTLGDTTPNPRSLFANNEAGLALDVEAAYLRGWVYQDSAGATVAAAAGDPVGLILDTAKGGLDSLGSDLVSNGTFASDTVWTKGANWTIGSGVATKTGGAANNLTQTISSTAGQWYRITMDVTRTAGTLTVSLGTSGTTRAISADGSYTFYILAGSSTQTLTLAGDSAFAGTVDNVTARLVPGNHAYQTTSGSRPALARTPDGGRRNLWLNSEPTSSANYSAASNITFSTDSLFSFLPSGGACVVFADSSVNRQLAQTRELSSGKTYTLSFYVKIAGGGLPNSGAGLYRDFTITRDGSDITNYSLITYDDIGSGVYRAKHTWAHSGASNSVTLWKYGSLNSSTEVKISGLQLEESSSATAYQKVGLTSDVTESGKRDCWGLLFDGSDDSLASSAIDFSGTDKMVVMAGVRKNVDTARATVCELTASIASNNGGFHLTAPNAASDTFAFESKGTSLTDAVATGIAAPATRVLTGIGNIAGDSTSLRVNGAVADTDTGDQGTGNYSNAILYIGSRAGTSLRFNGILYTLIIRGATTPTGTIADFERNLLARRCGVTF